MKNRPAQVLLALACAGHAFSSQIPVHWEGGISGVSEPDKHTLQLRYDRFESWWPKKLQPISLDSNYRFGANTWFLNTLPMCISLLLDGRIVDRYCGLEDRKVSKSWVMRNVFDSSEVTAVRDGRGLWPDAFRFEGLEFKAENFKRDSTILLFDLATLELSKSTDGKIFEFKVNDPSGSLGRIRVLYQGSFDNKNVIHEDGRFSIPTKDVEKRGEHSFFGNRLHVYVHSKMGGYHHFSINPWSETKAP